MTSRLLRLAVLGALLATPSRSGAATLPFVGELSLEMRVRAESPRFTLAGSGGFDANPGGGLHLTQGAIPGSVLAGNHLLQPITDPQVFPFVQFQLTASNGPGVFAEGAGALGGSMPLQGVWKVCLYGLCGTENNIANLQLPLSVVGKGGTGFVKGAVNLTVVGAPWTTGTAATPIGTLATHGSAAGPASLASSTAQEGGRLNLVSPIFISSNFGAAPLMPTVARLSLSFGGAPIEHDCNDGADNDGDGTVDFPADPGCTTPSDVSERELGHTCDDGVDNDGDGAVDFPADGGCASLADAAETEPGVVCDDGLDNDGDGAVDAADPGCVSRLDASEREATLVCDDGVDNDGDGVADHPADPGCASGLDGTETDPAVACDDGVDNDDDGLVDFAQDPGCDSRGGATESPECDDGVDNDGDGDVDYPADTYCAAPSDPTEFRFDSARMCADDRDNDGDGLADFPADPGCARAESWLERTACNDRLDNDGDGGIDFDGGAAANGGVALGPPDRDCSTAYRNTEDSPPCGLGAELALVLPLLAGWAQRRSKRVRRA